jgi:hypothetical protein
MVKPDRLLALILQNCEKTYFDPNLFRLNTNQFLQTSRTVTFIIQKHKSDIPSFETWYTTHVLAQWSNDVIMSWAKDSRNKIEKEGDLELHSSLSVTLIFSYIEDQDLFLPCGHDELIRANVKRLVRFAHRFLPTGVSDSAVVKIERRWVANSLSDWELLNALTFIYSRIYHACKALARHLESNLNGSIPDATAFDPFTSDFRKTTYIKLRDGKPSQLKKEIVQIGQDILLPPELTAFWEDKQEKSTPANLRENVQLYSEVAILTFAHHGFHIPMLFLLDDMWKLIEHMSPSLDDQATKFLFWRFVGDRILYLKPHALIWISEAWMREVKDIAIIPSRKMKITGEILGVLGLDQSGNIVNNSWKICRNGFNEHPWLEAIESEEDPFNMAEPNFLAPVLRAFKKLGYDIPPN